MSEETVVAAPSAAETPEFDHSRGPLVDLSPEQRSEYKRTGQLPKIEPKNEESAPSKEEPAKQESAPAQSAENAGDPAAPKITQEKAKSEKKHLSASDRIKQLRAVIEQEWDKDAPDHDKITRYENTIATIEAGQKRKTEATAPVAQPKEPQNPQKQPTFNSFEEWAENFEQKQASQWMEQWAKDHPEQSYESGNVAMFRYMRSVEQQFAAFAEQKRQWDAKLAEAESRYDNFNEIKGRFAEKVVNDPEVPYALKEVLDDSEVLADLIGVIAGSPEELANFVAMAKTAPTKAVRYIADRERLIRQAYEAKAAPKETPKAEPPAPPKTSAPKPPTEVGGRAASPGDALEEAARANDYRKFAAESTRRALASMK